MVRLMFTGEYGLTPEERLKDFQSGIMVRVIAQGALLIIIYRMLVGVLGNQYFVQMFGTFLIALSYLIYNYRYWKERDVHGDYGAYTYKGVLLPINIKEEDKMRHITDELNNVIKHYIMETSVFFIYIGLTVNAFILSYTYEGLVEFVLLMLMAVIVSTPVILFYVYSYNKMVNVYYWAITSPVYGLILEELEEEYREKGEELPLDVEGFISWLLLTDRKRKKQFTEEENTQFQEMEDVVKERAKDGNVRYLYTDFLDIQEDESIEQEDKIEKIQNLAEEDNQTTVTYEIKEYQLDDLKEDDLKDIGLSEEGTRQLYKELKELQEKESQEQQGLDDEEVENKESETDKPEIKEFDISELDDTYQEEKEDVSRGD